MADTLETIKEAVLKGDQKKAREAVEAAVKAGIPVEGILNKGLIAGMQIVGVKFKNNEYYVPEVLIAARAMNQAMTVVEPLIIQAGIKPAAKLAIGTVKGDLHDIGKNLVVMMWKGAGYQVEDLGIDVPPEKFAEAVKNGAQVVGLSALLTTTMIAMKEVVETLSRQGLKDKAKVVIGGAPVTQSFADEIGADGYAPDAASAVDVVKSLIGV